MATGAIQPFRPSGTVTLTASTTSAAIALAGGGGALLVFNAATTTAFLAFGTSLSLVATATCLPIPPGARMLIDCGPFVATVAAILMTGSGTIYFTKGEGNIY